LNSLWNTNVNGFTQQAITRDPWNLTNASGITNYINPAVTPLPANTATTPVEWLAFPGRIAYYFPQLPAEDVLSLADTGYQLDGTTSFPDITKNPCSGLPAKPKPYGPYGPRGWQDEYCEWSVTRNSENKITRIDFTCENPEYWNSVWMIDPQRVLELYRRTLDKPQIQLEDLYLYDPSGQVVTDPSTGTWVWATFEHIDNVPGSNGPSDTVDYNFFNPNCQSVTLNVPKYCLPKGGVSPVTVSCSDSSISPPYYLRRGGSKPVPIQITRLYGIDTDAQGVNNTMQAAIAAAYPGSVWQYYQLVNVIWSTDPVTPPRSADTVPVQLNAMLPAIPVANTTLESYAQSTTCTGCHQYAAIAPTMAEPDPNWAADFSFAFGTASYPGKQKVKRK
jgi:hypothetical protein